MQLGAGLGVFGTYASALFSSSSTTAGAIIVPFHFAVTPALWHMANGGRTGLHITLDVGPGFGTSPSSASIAFAFSTTLALGWEWY